MADAVSLKGAGGNDWAKAESILRDAGFKDYSSGLRNWVLTGATDYSAGDAQKYGLPMSQSMMAEEAARQRMEAIKPAVESLQASKPEATSIYTGRSTALEAERNPTIARYDSLIAEIKGDEGRELATTGKVLGNEYGKRGIPLSSGMYEQDLAGKQAATTRYYGNEETKVGLAKSADLRDLDNMLTELTNSHVQVMRDIDNQIAQLQAGAGNQAITDALAQYRDQEQRKFEGRFDELERESRELANRGASAELAVKEGERSLMDLINQYGGLS